MWWKQFILWCRMVLEDVDGSPSSKRVAGFILLALTGYTVIVQQDIDMAKAIGTMMLFAFGITVPDRWGQKK